MIEGEKLIKTLPNNFLQIFEKYILNSQVIVKSVIEADVNFFSNSQAWTG